MFSFSDVYNMPIYLRKFYFKRLQKHYKDESEAIKKTNQKGVKISLKPGDMLVYRGCELEHWRKKFK